MQAKKFQKNKEDFTCEKCGFFARGTGYTNHCPKCLWSKHVDVNPGDRKSKCQGLMEPTSAEIKGENYIIVHKCRLCGLKKRNKTSKRDNFSEIIKLSAFIPKSGK